jgi:glycosyltransferase involved in cell wall biosynthesis
LFPFRSIPSFIPIKILGMHNLPRLKKYEKKADIIHIFFPYLVNFYFFRFLSKPLIYTITSGVDEKCSGPSLMYPCKVVVSSDHDAALIRTRGFRDINVIRPGIDLSKIMIEPAPEHRDEFVILAGSSPWIKSQFSSKGFDLLLKALTRIPDIRLVCLWRGGLYEEWYRRVLASGLASRVEIINEKADISKVLSRCHAAVVLATRADQVKSFPNSLMEALAAGKPVLINRAIPMSYYIEEYGCGRVIESLTIEELVTAIKDMRDRYSIIKSAADLVGRRDFSSDRMVNEYCGIYHTLIK